MKEKIPRCASCVYYLSVLGKRYGFCELSNLMIACNCHSCRYYVARIVSAPTK